MFINIHVLVCKIFTQHQIHIWYGCVRHTYPPYSWYQVSDIPHHLLHTEEWGENMALNYYVLSNLGFKTKVLGEILHLNPAAGCQISTLIFGFRGYHINTVS